MARKTSRTAWILGPLAAWLWLTLGALGAQASFLQEDPIATWLDEARRHVEDFEYQAALRLYEKVLERQPDHFQALCGAAYSGGMVGKFSNGEEQERLYQRSFERARQALELKPEDAESNFAMAWALGGQALLAGAREKVKLADQMRIYLEKALEKNPQDHRAWFVLGSWRYRIATAGFLERTAANLFFGGLPEEGDLKMAVEAYRKAVELRPESILYRYELARALQKAGLNEEAREHYEKAAQLEPRTPEDPTLLARCRYQADQLR
ncbi:MAG TPA: tetratricopeptide repeat protein [Acidobacteriota bacterium]|nr:tetratricopeptide repeat protein [Acidobacteriota bacterium]